MSLKIISYNLNGSYYIQFNGKLKAHNIMYNAFLGIIDAKIYDKNLKPNLFVRIRK